MLQRYGCRGGHRLIDGMFRTRQLERICGPVRVEGGIPELVQAEDDVDDERSDHVWVKLGINLSTPLSFTNQSAQQLFRAALSATNDHRDPWVTRRNESP